MAARRKPARINLPVGWSPTQYKRLKLGARALERRQPGQRVTPTDVVRQGTLKLLDELLGPEVTAHEI